MNYKSQSGNYLLTNKKTLMKTIILILGSVLAIILGFVFAGLLGAFLLGCILTFSIYLMRKLSKKEFAVINIATVFSALTIFGYGLMYFGGLLGSDKGILEKLSLIEKDLEERNYNASWVIISQKRGPIFNSILSNSAKESYHLKGIAIDIYVFDINGDGTFDTSDIKILESSNNSVEKKNPELIGAFGHYFLKKNGYFTKHMIHIDTRGKKIRYPK